MLRSLEWWGRTDGGDGLAGQTDTQCRLCSADTLLFEHTVRYLYTIIIITHTIMDILLVNKEDDFVVNVFEPIEDGKIMKINTFATDGEAAGYADMLGRELVAISDEMAKAAVKHKKRQ